jgi:putative transposase
VSLLAYVCMPNHFHLLLMTHEANLSEFMRHFNISYTSAFNRMHRRVGHLYQGRYKSYLIDADSYLLEVSRYIHLNPVRRREFARKTPEERREALFQYAYSSFGGYVRPSRREKVVHCRLVLSQMGGDDRKGRERYRRFVLEGIDGEMESPLNLGKGHGIVGDEDFVKLIRGRYVKDHGAKREQPALRELGKLFEPDELVKQFLELTGKDVEDICRRGKNSLERAMLMELLYRFCQLPQAQIGRLVGGIDYSGVSQVRRRLRERLNGETRIRRRFDELSKKLANLSRLKI